MKNKKIISLVLFASLISTQVGTQVFAAENNNPTTIENNSIVDNSTVVNNFQELKAAINDPSITSIKLNANINLTEHLYINHDLIIDGNNNQLNFSNYRLFNLGKIINLTFNNISISNPSNHVGSIYSNSKSNITYNNVIFTGGRLGETDWATVTLSGKSKFTTTSYWTLTTSSYLNITDNSNIDIVGNGYQDYGTTYWPLLTSGMYDSNNEGGFNIGNNVYLNITANNSNVCMGAPAGYNPNLTVGGNSKVLLNTNPTLNVRNCPTILNIKKMSLDDTATLRVNAGKYSAGAFYQQTNFDWNFNGADVEASSDSETNPVFFNAGCTGHISFGNSSNLKDLSLWSKSNFTNNPNIYTNNPIYGVLGIYGSTINNANIINDTQLNQDFVNNGKNGFSKLIIGKTTIKTNKSELKNLLDNKANTEGMTPESTQAYNNAITAGQKVLDNQNATQKEVDDAVQVIRNAINDLKVDTTALKDALDKAKELSDKYNLTADALEKLNDAIAKANSTLNDLKSTIDDINNALRTLNSTIDKIINSANKAELKDLLENKANTDGMTPESTKAYNDAIAAGQKVLDNQDATQKDINNAIEEIKNAKDALKADTTPLKDALDKVKDIPNKHDLTADSLEKLNDAIAKGESILNTPNLTVDDINNAVKELNAIANNLVNKANKAELKDLLENKANTDGMTPESIKAYNDAIAAGQKVLDNQDATQKEVDDAVKAIEKAKEELKKLNIESDFQDAYWIDNALVLDGVFNATNNKAGKLAPKTLLIKDKDNKVIERLNTINASWGNGNGYQCIINNDIFKNIENGTYKLFISSNIDDIEYEAPIKQTNSLLSKLIEGGNINNLKERKFDTDIVKFSSDSDNNIIFSKEKDQLKVAAEVNGTYFIPSGLVIDGNFGFEGVSLDDYLGTKLVLKDSSENVVKTVSTWNANWGEKNTGFQGIIGNDDLDKLSNGEYTLYAFVNYDGIIYEKKLTSVNNTDIAKTINNFKITTKSNDSSITIAKSNSQTLDSNIQIKQSYWDGDNFVINGLVNDLKNVSKNDSKKLIIKDSDGKVIEKIDTVGVDWFSNKNNFSGFQAIIPSSILNKLSLGEYSFEVNTNHNGDNYLGILKQEPSLLRTLNIFKDINSTEEKIINNFAFKFSTNKENNVILNVKDLVKEATSIANNIYWSNDYNYYTINGDIKFDGNSLNLDGKDAVLVFKDSNSKVVGTSNSVFKGWNAANPYQALINQESIDSLTPGTYTIYLKVNENNETYEAPIKLKQNLELDTKEYSTDRYTINLGLNSNNELSITIK